jgi:uncharacterized protein (DUF924 family)
MFFDTGKIGTSRLLVRHFPRMMWRRAPRYQRLLAETRAVEAADNGWDKKTQAATHSPSGLDRNKLAVWIDGDE